MSFFPSYFEWFIFFLIHLIQRFHSPTMLYRYKTFHFFLYENVPTYSMTLKNPFQMIGHFYTDVMRFLRHPKSFAFTEHEYHLVHVIEFKSGE